MHPTLSPTPDRYELLYHINSNKYAILDYRRKAWATVNGSTWESLETILTAHDFNYSFKEDYEKRFTARFTIKNYSACLDTATHITRLGYFSSLDTFRDDYPEFFL